MMVLIASLALFSEPALTTANLQLSVERLRNNRGLLHLCLTVDQRHFPDCSGDPRAIRRTVSATNADLRLTGITPGDYALTILHDENGNGKLDMVLGIPREGFGFSRNPTLRFAPPRFEQVRITLKSGFTRETIHMRYLL